MGFSYHFHLRNTSCEQFEILRVYSSFVVLPTNHWVSVHSRRFWVPSSQPLSVQPVVAVLFVSAWSPHTHSGSLAFLQLAFPPASFSCHCLLPSLSLSAVTSSHCQVWSHDSNNMLCICSDNGLMIMIIWSHVVIMWYACVKGSIGIYPSKKYFSS